MVEISRHVRGIKGLYLATDCFSEEVEKRIFLSGYKDGTNERTLNNGGKVPWRAGHVSGPSEWPDDYFKLVNLIRDCGLLPGYVPPDYCFRIVYPEGAGFFHHYDSRHRWGEVIVGVTVGQSGVIYFVPKDGQESLLPPGRDSIEVVLPRRSIYVMSDASRYDWKHGIVKHRPTHPSPSWNTNNLRISLTLRSKKVYSDVYLERQLLNETDVMKRAELSTRIAEQKKFYPVLKKNGPKLTKSEVEEQRKKANALLDFMDSGAIPAHLRFHQHEVTSPLPKSDNRSGVASASAPAAATVFPGRGRLLGSADDDDDKEMKNVLEASIRSYAKEEAARKRKIDLVDLVSSCEEEDDEKKESICKKKTPEVITIDH
jgi:hypothetical protein